MLTHFLDPKCFSYLLGVVGWNLICLFYKEVVRSYEYLYSAHIICLKTVNSLSFLTSLCAYYTDTCKVQTSGIQMDQYVVKEVTSEYRSMPDSSLKKANYCSQRQ